MEEKKYGYEGETDKRILMRMLLEGEITEEHLQAYLAELPDLSSSADEMIIE
jgi:hypothetical protein